VGLEMSYQRFLMYQKQAIISGINNADKRRSARSAFQAVAFKAALIDVRIIASVKFERSVAVGTRDFLRFRDVHCLEGRDHKLLINQSVANAL
jgi:hypothetical protein